MKYINTKTLEYPLTEQQIRLANPTVSYGRPFNPKGYAIVTKEEVSYNPNTQKTVPGDVVIVDGNYIEQQIVVDLTEEEFNAMQPSEDRIDRAAEIKILKKQFETMTVPEEEINDYASLFPAFKVGESVSIGDKRQYEGEVWEVIQAHTTQLDWLPPDVPALWKRVYDPETIQLWVQPTGAHDAYNIGDKVYWPDENTTWESTIDANTTVPGENPIHGYWVEVT
jgi:hypothetical protein